ncbi:MAG TPA: 5'-nucleotidase C-terminal domain-containing protein [Longimicrobiales bacterium]|nr:5'-nucleotidase C-terminal domain-containing protein [Longimicrobiales bacterium]
MASAATVELVLLGTTDVHNRLYPYDYYTGEATSHGLALLAPAIDSIRAAHPGRVFLFDSGDLLQGNPLGALHARLAPGRLHPVARAMNLLGYDAAAIGNHEYNYGLALLDTVRAQARFPFVSANVFEHGTDRHAHAPWVLLPHEAAPGDTVLIGVTGNTPPGVHLWDGAHVAGVLEFRDVVPALHAAVSELRRRGADVVVVLSHGGLEGTSYDTAGTGLAAENVAARVAREVSGIDVMFLGHTHRELADTTINGVLLTQARQWAGSLAVATLRLQRHGPGDWRVAAKQGRLVSATGRAPDRAFLDSLRWEHERTVEHVSARIGRATAALPVREGRVRDTPVLDFMNEVQRRAAGADLSANAAYRLGAGLPEGDITVADVAALYPYDNTLRAVRISGAQLRAYLEKSAEYYAPPGAATVTNFDVPGYNFDIVSGVDYTLDVSRPVGQRVTRLERAGRSIAAHDSFTLALTNYRQGGGGGFAMIASAPVVYDRQEDIRELLIEEIRRRGTIDPAEWFEPSWELVPAEAAERALAEQTAREAPRAARSDPTRPRLRVIAGNDFHGRLEPERPSWANGRQVGGAAALASFYRHEAAGFGGAPVLLLDGGDVMQGTPISNLTQGRSTIDFFNLVGYDGAALGNHEYDWGIATLQERIEQAEFPWLSANTLVAGADTAPSWIRPTAIITAGGLRIGLIGLSTESTPFTTKAENVRGLRFIDGAATLDLWVPRLRAQNVDFVIAVAHAGGVCEQETRDCRDEIIDWARGTTERPDLIVAGHTHQVVRTVENGIPIIETGAYGTRYGIVDLERVSPDSVDVWIRGTPTTFVDLVEPDSAAAALVARYAAAIAPQVEQVVARTAEPIPRGAGEHPVGRLIADAQRWATGAQIAIMNNGGVRAALDSGTVTWGKVYQVHPFGNLLIKLQLTGAQVREALEHAVRAREPRAQVSGLTAYYDTTAAAGQRLLSVRLDNGAPLETDAVYTVVVNDFLAGGEGDGFGVFGRALHREPTDIADLDALIDYLRSFAGPVPAPRDERLRPAGAP